MRHPVVIALLALAFFAGLYAGWLSRVEPPAPKIATVLEPPREIAPFSLTGTEQPVWNNAALRGQWTLLFFGFTRCPDICPTTLQMLAGARERLIGTLADDSLPGIVLISVDPEHDDLETLRRYSQAFGDGVSAARGDAAALQAFSQDLGILYQRIPLEEGDYTMDHSAAVLLIDPDSQLRAVFSPPLRSDAIAADLEQIIRAY